MQRSQNIYQIVAPVVIQAGFPVEDSVFLDVRIKHFPIKL